MTTTFSLLYSLALRVQLKLPVRRYFPSTMANLWCMWAGLLSIATGTPASASTVGAAQMAAV